MENYKHHQLFFNVTGSVDTSKLTPAYCREVIRINKRQKLYWYNAALKEVPRPKSSPSDRNDLTNETSLPVTLWDIHPAEELIFSRFLRGKPRKFNISCRRTGMQSSFEYEGEKSEPLSYSGEINAPFNNYFAQKYRWVRYGDGSKWVFIAKNDPHTPLAEFRRASLKNEFYIVFLEDAPPGWNSRMVDRSNRMMEYTGYPSYPSPAISQDSGYSDPIYLSESSIYSGSISPMSPVSPISPMSPMSPMSLMSTPASPMSISSPTYGVTDFFYRDDNSINKFWQEYVLASTVTIQDEVNPIKRRLWK